MHQRHLAEERLEALSVHLGDGRAGRMDTVHRDVAGNGAMAACWLTRARCRSRRCVTSSLPTAIT
jgi:hypothetical protein